MTLLSRRKRRTTVRRITPATLAAKLAALVALVATPALAQPPPSGYQPPNYPPSNYQPLNYQSAGGQPPAGWQQPAGGQQPGGLPLPPGYRPRTPPPQAQVQPQRPPLAAGAMPGSGTGGKVMYFQKPADALAATGGADETGAVAQLDDPNRGPLPVPVPDAPAPALPPPPPASRYLPADRPLTPPPAVVVPPVTTTAYGAQPKPGEPGFVPPSTSLKKEVRPVDPIYIQLPPRENIFMVYNDAQLERAIMERIIADRIKEFRDRINEKREALKNEKDPNQIAKLEMDIVDLEKSRKELLAINDPSVDPTYRFPALPVVSPPGVAYQPKTAAYAPRKVILEPGYIVHRRLHFEEKNSERAAWDLGPMTTLVSAAYFWKDTLLLPQSLASGCVYGHWDTSAGKCLPGSPSPYYLYPPGLTLTGTAVEGVVVTGAVFLLP
jgi:hypothetical protein